MKARFVLYSLILLCSSCEQFNGKENPSKEEKTITKNKTKEGLVVNHRPDGEVLSEVNYKDKKRDGLAKSYHKNGAIHQEINYKDGLKDGLANTYYENGTLFKSTPYKAGKIDGIQKKYRDNGKLMAEIPYKNGQPGKGLKEYLVDGKLKTQYPEINIVPIDKMLKENSFHLKLSLSQNLKKTEFFVGNLDGGYLPSDLRQLAPRTSKSDFQIDYFVPPGTFIMEKVNIVCKATTILGNPYIIEKSYNVAVENKGF